MPDEEFQLTRWHDGLVTKSPRFKFYSRKVSIFLTILIKQPWNAILPGSELGRPIKVGMPV